MAICKPQTQQPRCSLGCLVIAGGADVFELVKLQHHRPRHSGDASAVNVFVQHLPASDSQIGCQGCQLHDARRCPMVLGDKGL